MKFRIIDLLLLTSMVASLLAMWQSPEIFPWLVVLLSSLFAVPVCHECVRLVTAETHSRSSLLRALQPAWFKWGLLWLGYFVALEFFLYFVVGGLSLVVSASTAGWLSLQIALSVILAPGFRRMRTLLPVVFFGSLVTTAAMLLLAAGAVYVLASSGLVGSGYMGDEFMIVFLTPMVAGGMLIVVLVIYFVEAKQRRKQAMAR